VRLPYITIPDLHIGPLPIHPFGLLVATGVVIGSSLALRRAPRFGLERRNMESLISWILIVGFVLSHMLDQLMYYPGEVVKDPLRLLRIWESLSSYGGFIGATVGALLWKRRTKEKILPYLEQIAAVFPISWIFGRMGCSVAHDHIGRITTSFLAVDFPRGRRFDLGLLEMLIAIPLAAVMLWYARKPRPTGAILGLLSVLYAPIRFPLDALRATDIHGADARYVGLTPGQWLSVLLFFVGVGLLVRAYKFLPTPAAADPAPAATTDGAPPHAEPDSRA
jgi:phosphatidylglycerol:prolipoprotein diacylglycerol transferase